MFLLLLLMFGQEIDQDFNDLIWLMIILTFLCLIILLMLMFTFYLEMKDGALFSILFRIMLLSHIFKMLCRVSCKTLNRNVEPNEEVRLCALRKGGKICLVKTLSLKQLISLVNPIHAGVFLVLLFKIHVAPRKNFIRWNFFEKS